jgi:predicted dehydrogenase
MLSGKGFSCGLAVTGVPAMRIGIIGLKGHQGVVLKGAKELGNCEVVAVSDDNSKELNNFRKKEPLASEAETYTDWRMLIEHSMLDVCCVADENYLRLDQLLALAERNIHIVTEKPLTTTLEDLDRLRTGMQKSKSRLTMLLTMRHEPKYMAMRKLIQQGAVGPVCQIAAQKSYRFEDRPDWQKSRERLGGTIPYIGIHALDLMRWTTGLDFTHVAAFHGNGGTPEFGETEDHASIVLRCKNGASASARLDYLRPHTAPTHGDDRLRIAGGEGILEAVGAEPELLLMTNKKEPHRIKPEPTANLFVDFVQAVKEDRPSRIPAEDCFYMTELVLKARQAADEKRMIEL